MSTLNKHQQTLLQNVYDKVHDAYFSIDSIDLKNNAPKELDQVDYDALNTIWSHLMYIDRTLLNLLERNNL